MTLTDYMSSNKGPPEWIEENQIVSVQGRVGEDIIVELKFASPEHYDDLRFELIRDGLPISSDRYRLSMRGNIVQLALKQSRKNDAGYYSLIATRLGQENNKGALKKIYLGIDESNYEEDEPPIFLRRLSDLAVKVGTRTRFLTEIRSATPPKISWYKNDVSIHEGSRFSLVHEGNFYCVDVAPVTIEDQGCWTCMAENRSGRSSCTSNLTVVVPKAYKKPEFVEELRALLTETGTVSLECKVIGVPTPILRWFKDNKEIKAGDVFALTANPDDPTSLGVYTCEAVNCMGVAYSSSKVHVVGRGSREGSLKPADTLTPSGPLPIFKRILQDEYCRIGETLVLSCQVQVPPWPKAIVWYNKEGRVEPNERYLIMEDGIGGYSIEVRQIEAIDEGEWKCVATSEENMKQFSSCYVAVAIPRNYRKPRFMENLKAVLTEEGLVSFECKVVGFPTPLLRWFKDGQELKPGDVYQLTGTNSLGSYCCIARNCMGEAKSIAELTIEDIQNQLNEEERFQLLSSNQPPKFIKGLRSCEARINDDFRFTIQVSVAPEPNLSWYRDDTLVDESNKYNVAKEHVGMCHLEVRTLEFVDQAEWKCVAVNDFGHSVTSCFLKLIIPKHYKKPKFLEELRAMLSEEGAVNLECKVIGVPQPVLKWYKDNAELKPGDIHRIISGQDGSCCLGTYTCEATNCMGTVSSSASLLGFEDRKTTKEIQSPNGHELARNLSLSTIHEERTSQLYDTPQTDHSVTLDDKGEVSFSFDGKEVSVSLYETPDLTEEEALQIVEMYADQLSEHVTEHNVIELPPMRFVKETSTSGNLLMEAVVIDVSPDYFVSADDGDDLRTEADFEDVSIMEDLTHVLSSPERDSRNSLKRSAKYSAEDDEKAPSRPPRKKSITISSSKSEKTQRIESDSFHSAQKDELPLSPVTSLNQDDSDTFADALSSAHLSMTEGLVQKYVESVDNRKRSLSADITIGSSQDDGIGGDSSLDSVTDVPKKKKQRKDNQLKDKNGFEEYCGDPSNYEERKISELDDKINSKNYEDKIETEIKYETEQIMVKEESTILSEKSISKINEESLYDLGSLQTIVPEISNLLINANISEETQELKEIDKQISTVQLTESIQTNVLKNLNIGQSLSNIYYILSSVLEKQEKNIMSSHLSSCIEELRQIIGSIAVTIANLKEPTDNEIIEEIDKLKESLLKLQGDLLIKEHECNEHQILNDLLNPISKLKDITRSVVENSSIKSTMLIFELLEQIEKDMSLIAKEISKKRFEEERVTASVLAESINNSLYSIKQWLSTTSEDGTDKESALSSTIEELKRDVTKIEIQTSYSESQSDKSLIEALIDLREPLIRLKNAISIYHKSDDVSTLEDLDRSMKHLLQNIMDVLCEYTEEESLQPIVDIVEQIEHQISLTIKDVLYQKEFKHSIKMFTVETAEEEAIATSQETIPSTFAETASTSPDLLPTEQVITEENSKERADSVVVQILKDEKQNREEITKRFIKALSEILEKLQLEVTDILEDFEQAATGTTIPQSKLANSLEELRRTISTICIVTKIHGEEVISFDENIKQIAAVLMNLLQPLVNIEKLLSRTHEHDVLELTMLNRITLPLDIIENNIVKQMINFIDNEGDIEKELESLICILEEIKEKIPIIVQNISTKRELLECLHDISKPLENILERMSGLERSTGDRLEADVAKILGKPISSLLNDVQIALQEVDILDRRKLVILELRKLVEPLLEFHSCLSMVQSSRKSLVPEASLLDERKSVILRAVDGLQKQLCHIMETIANMEKDSLFEESLRQLNNAISLVEKQIEKTDYSRSNSTKVIFQHRLTDSLNHLENAIIDLEKHMEKDTYEIVAKCLEALQKQISLAQAQLNQVCSQSIDEEAIVEGFLYPANQLLSALNTLKENIQQKTALSISHNLMNQFHELANSVSELGSFLSLHRTELIREGTSEGAPIVETFSAVMEVLNDIKDYIMTIDKIIETKQQTSSFMTEAKDVIETTQITQKEMESVIEEQKPAQSKMEDVSMTRETFDLPNLETMIETGQKEDELTDMKENIQKGEQIEKQKQYQTQILKFDTAINNLERPIRELINFMKSAMQESLVSRSEEDKRKIRELTMLIQILYDLQATAISIKAVLSSLSILLLESELSYVRNILVDLEQVLSTVISLIQEEVRPELKENVMIALQSFADPLDAFKNILISICQTIDENKYVDSDEQLTVTKVLIPCISDAIKSLKMIQELEHTKFAEDKKIEIPKIKEDAKDIEEKTAQPLEEIIEAIMVSQEQVKHDKSSAFESNSSSVESIEPKVIDDLNAVTEIKLETALTNEVDNSSTEIASCIEDEIRTPQQKLTSTPTPIENLPIQHEEIILQSLEDVKEQSVSPISQQEMELNQLSKNDTMQEKQAEAETLQTIISSLQVLHRSFTEIEEMEVSRSLIELLRNLEITLHPEVQQIMLLTSKDTESIKQRLQKLPIISIIEELQKSIATIQEQLDTVVKMSSSEEPNLQLMQAIKKLLKDLKISIAHIQSDPIIYQLIQQDIELSTIQRVTILGTIVNAVQEFAERCRPIISHTKTETGFVPQLQIIEQGDQELNQDILQKIIDPIHVLHETLSQIENLGYYEIGLTDIPEEKKAIVHLNTVKHSLEKLEQSLIANVQQIGFIQEEVAKKLSENQISLVDVDQKPILKELIDSIMDTQQQIAINKNIATTKILNETLENLEISLATVEEVVDHFDEITEIKQVQTLVTFAKSIEETKNQLLIIINQQMTQREIKGTALLQLVSIPIEELQKEILKLEDRVSQASKMKEESKIVNLEHIVLPLQQLQQVLSTASHQEVALSLQQLPIKPILKDLNKSMTILQDQAMVVEDKLLVKMNTEDLSVLKDFVRSLGDLRTSIVVLQQLNAIENAGQQIIEIENTSALQAFAKSIEEFRKCCLIINEQPRIIEAFAINVELEEPIKVETQLLENIIAPLRILQEQILTIEETKMQEPETLDTAEINKATTVLSSLVGPLQHLEKSFVATVQKEHVIEHETCSRLTPEPIFASLEKLTLQPILQEMQQSIASVQENMILEAGSQATSEEDSFSLLKTIAQPLVDLKASIASIQQATAIAPDSLNELIQQQNVTALETFAETLHNLVECIGMCNQQHIIIEPAADTISEDASSLNTWADIIEEPVSKITRPIVVDQGRIETPTEITTSILEDEVFMLKTLAKPLTELRECLALIVEERTIVTPSETTYSLSEDENISLLKTMIKPLWELRDAAAVVIQEQMTIERASEHSFEGSNEFTLRPLIEPLEELRHSIAIIQDQLLIETLTDRPTENIIKTLIEPLLDLQRAISVLETRVMSPDVESIQTEEMNNSWITERLAISLQEIDKSITDIRQCTIIKPETIIAEKQAKILMPDWSTIEKLMKSMETIESIILRMEDEITSDEIIQELTPKVKILKTLAESLIRIQENLMLLRDKSKLSTFNEDHTIDSIIESLFNFEKCISFVEEKITDKAILKRSDAEEIDTVFAVLNLPLIELKRSITTMRDTPSTCLKNLEGPLELVQNAFETILTILRNEKLSKISTKLSDTVLFINYSTESIKCILKKQQKSFGIETHVECEEIEMLTKSLQNITSCIAQIREEPSSVTLISTVFQNLDKCITIMQQQSFADKSVKSQYATIRAIKLIPCLQELQKSIETSKKLWCEETITKGLISLEKPFYELQAVFNTMHEEFLIGATKEYKTEETIKKTKLVQDKKLPIVNDGMKDKEDKEKIKKEEEKEIKEEMKKKEIKKLIEEELVQSKQEEENKEIEEKYQKTNQETSCIEKQIEKDERKEASEKKSTEEKQINKKETNREEVTQSKKIEIIEDKKAYMKITDIENIEKQEKDKEVKQIEQNTTENIKNGLQESKKLTEVEIIKERDKPVSKKEHQETKHLESEQEAKEKITKERKEPSEEIQKDLNIRKEEVKDEKTKKIEDTEKEEMQSKKMEKQQQENTEESKKIKITGEQHKIKDEIKKMHDKEEKNETEKTKEIQENMQEYLKIEAAEIQKEEEKQYNKPEIKDLEEKEKQSVFNDEKIKNKPEDYKNEQDATQLIKNKDMLDKESSSQLKKEKKEEKEQKTEKTLEKLEEEGITKKIKDISKSKLEKEKKEESAQKKQEKEQDKENIKRPEKMDKEQKQAIQSEEIKMTKDDAASIQENKIEVKQESNRPENEKIERTSNEYIREKEEQNEYVNNVKKEDINEKKHKEVTEHVKEEKEADGKLKQEDKLDKITQELWLAEDKNLKQEKIKQKRTDDKLKQQDINELRVEKIEELTKEKEYKEQKSSQKQNHFEEAERINKDDRYKLKIEEKTFQRKNIGERLQQREIERIERKRNDEKSSDEIARLLREEAQKLREKQEEEISRNKQRREEQIREDNWSRKRQNESERFLRNLLDTKYKPHKSITMFVDVDYFPDKRKRASPFDFGIPLSDTSRSSSWRDSLASLSRRRIDDYRNYKLHDVSMDKYYFNIGSFYKRPRRKETRISRGRSMNLLKYEDYPIGGSCTSITSSAFTHPIRRLKMNSISRINLDSESSPSSYSTLNQRENFPWNKPKKPSFCTRLTNRIIGVGMRTRLTCTVLGNPEPHVYWTKDDEKLNALANRYKTQFENGMAYLELYDALPEDAGIYTCVAENTHGTSSTESMLKVYSDYKPTHSPPTFVRSIKDTYRYPDSKLILECRIRAHPAPTVSWLKDGKSLQDERYKQIYLDDDIYQLEITSPNISDNGQYTCRAENELRTDEISHIIHVEDQKQRTINRYNQNLSFETGPKFIQRPRSSNLLWNYNMPIGEAMTFQVPEVKIDTMDIISSSSIDGGKPAMFISRPSKKSIEVIVGEDVSISFRVTGIPKPRVTWMKGLKDITDGPRSYKESIDDYVRLTLKRATSSDEGTYCILVKNRYGCDRYFFSIKMKQRARSLTPLSDWGFVIQRDEEEEHNQDMSYVRNVPGPISSEPIVVDGGKNWLSLTWGKAEINGPAPVTAYKVEAWLLGGEGGARWIELGITPINAFDAFNLRSDAEYKFRVTPRNRYGWGESITMTNAVLVSEIIDLPEFKKILPGQLKALEGTTIKLECEICGDQTTEVRWYHETMELNPHDNSKFAIYYNGFKCSLTIMDVKENEAGRYVCEASNRIGKVSSFARILVVTDPSIIEADTKLRTSIESNDRPPQFTMRIRDRRVQTTYPIRLTCQIIGHPIPEITWYKNGKEISQDDRHIFWNDGSNFHTLEIIHSTLDDSGCYMVTARNINGSVSCRCTLIVDKGIRAYIAPEFLRGLDAVYTIQSGGELRMSAQLEAYPSVGIVWHRDGIRLRTSRRAIMTLDHDGTVQFSLINVTAQDAGVYCCTATNVVGHTETSTKVAVITDMTQNQSDTNGLPIVTTMSSDIQYSKEPFFITKPSSTEAVEGDTVIILCEVIGDPKPEVIWLRDFLKPDYYKDAPHFRLVGTGPQYRLEIPYAKLDFTGTYSVIARNCHGEAKAVISLQVYAKGQGKENQMHKSLDGKMQTLPIIKRELHDLRCCDGDAVSLECKVQATPKPPLVRWERRGKVIPTVSDFLMEFDGETARLNIQHVYPEDEGEYTCVAYNDIGKACTTACLVVDVFEGKENILNQRLTRPIGLLSTVSTPRSTPRSTPIRSLSPAVSRGHEFNVSQIPLRNGTSRQPKVCPPKFYSMPHNRLVQEGETVHFQCAVVGHPTPWVKWDKNGIVVTPSTRISIKERDDVKILEIVDAIREDSALYRITAENDFGRIEASARLEVISRYESASRTVRTRSASPRTYPSFERSLLSTTSRINNRLQLECRIKGTPSPTPTWYRNGRPLERSVRIKKYFDGTTAKMEISKIKASDAGEYTCVATNILGSTRSSCQVMILNFRDSSIADKCAPKFLQILPKESIIMENHYYEFQTGITGTPPFTVTWSKDGRELPDNDYYKYIVYADGCINLRLSNVRPQDAGEYTCTIRNDFGVAICSGLLAVEDYKNVSKLALQFTKTPLSVTIVKGATACFCTRIQCSKVTEVIWTINGKDTRENEKCKIEKDGNISILKICNVSLHDTGEIRCKASVNGKHLSISCTAKLQLRHLLYNLDNSNLEKIKSRSQNKLSLTHLVNMPEKIPDISSSKYQRRCKRLPIYTEDLNQKEAYKKKLTKATIINIPTDITILKGNKAVIKVTYQGYPEPVVKWFQTNRQLHSDDRIRITSRNTASWLTLNDVTYDYAGKYKVSVENSLSKDQRFFSLAVKGPPEPPKDKPSVCLSPCQAIISWQLPPYDGGCSVIGYTIEAKRASENTWTVISELCHSLTHTISIQGTDFIIPGESYSFRIRAENIYGYSDPGIESDPARISKHKEMTSQIKEKDKFEMIFEDRAVNPEEARLFDERYNVIEELGKGRYGLVKKVIERTTGMNFAAKFVRTIKAKVREQVREEIKIMNELRHPKLLQLVAAYESPRETIMITEYISGGELFERVVADDFTLTELDSILFMRQICEAVEYMHQKKIVHLDLKPENIMCCTRTSHQIKLIDFGLAQILKSDTPIRVLFGTPEFIPPEIINYEPIGTESDMWSVGIICYVLLTGLSPFMGDNDAETFANITRAEYDLEDEAFDAISNNAKEFINGLLIKRKELRMSAKQCLEHPWIMQHLAAMSRIILPTDKLKKFIVRRKWQKTGNAIRALGRMAILSAHSKRSSITTNSSSSPEQQYNNFEINSNDESKLVRADVNENIQYDKAGAKENLHSLCIENIESHKLPTNDINDKQFVFPINNPEHKVIQEVCQKIKPMTIDANNLIDRIDHENEHEKIPTTDSITSKKLLMKKEKSTDNPSKLKLNTKEKLSEIDLKLIPKSEDGSHVTKADLEKFISEENKVHTLHRILQCDSDISQIDNCTLEQRPSLLQIKESETTSEEMVNHNQENEIILKKNETLKNQQYLTVDVLPKFIQAEETLSFNIGSNKNNGKIAKSGMIKALCETNPKHKDAFANENTDTRILIGRNHNKFRTNGNVSRTARIFERENETQSNNSQEQRIYPANKSHNERIQKAFAFWNK